MKQLKLLLLGVVSALLMLFVVFIPMRANALTIANGVPNALQREGKAFYKFTLEDDSVITMNWANNKNGLAEFEFYADKNRTTSFGGTSFPGKSGKFVFALKRGTYYIEMHDGDTSHAPTAKVKLSWESAGKYAGTNYSLATAKNLKANTPETVVQIRKYNYVRWYKIKLTKTQRIILESNTEFGGIYNIIILDSKLQPVDKDIVDYDFMITYKKLPKGTYYFVIPENDIYSDYPFGEYISFKWH